MGAYERLGIKMDESKETVNEVLGISKEEAIEIIKTVSDAIEESNSVTEVMKKLLKKYDGIEAIFAVYSLGVQIGARRAITNVLMAAAREGAVW